MYSFRILAFSILASLLIVAVPAFADIIHLKDGGQIEGKVISESETEVQLATKYGVQSIPMEQVKSIEKTPTIREIYRRKLDELQSDEPDSHYQLGLWCKEQGLDSEAKLQFREALKLDPDHHGSRVELGYVFYGGKWVHTDEISELIEEKGYVVHDGRLMTKEEYDVLSRYLKCR